MSIFFTDEALSLLQEKSSLRGTEYLLLESQNMVGMLQCLDLALRSEHKAFSAMEWNSGQPD